jgi:predicted AAA+ superfamily ATPase
MIYRDLSPEITRLLQYFSVVVLTGPRQSGKTTLCKAVLPNFAYFNLEDKILLRQISEEPRQFLEQYGQQGVIIDEVQSYPELFSFIQVVADTNPNYRFVLTGSNNFSLMHSLTQSLAGRAALLTLLPLSFSELKDKLENDTDTLLFNGTYPAVWGRNIPANDVYRNYCNTYIERDVRQLLKVKDITQFQRFIHLSAGRIGTEFNASSFSNDMGVSVHTIQDWMSVLEASYIVFRLQPFYSNIGKRLIKTPKMYFYDTGLVCFLLGIETPKQLATHPIRGLLFENMIISDFMKNKFNAGKSPNYLYYRDKSQREIDIIQELSSNEYRAFEVKSAKNYNPEFFNNLKYLKILLGDKLLSTQIIYDGDITKNSSENGVIKFRNLNDFYETTTQH